MTRLAPMWLSQERYPAGVDRNLLGALWPVGAVEGFAIASISGNTITLTNGRAAVPAPNGTGSVLCVSTANEAIDMTAGGTIPGPPAGQNRYDLIVIRALGSDIGAGSTNDFILDRVIGTPAAGTPTIPPVPAGCALAYRVYRPGGAAAITQPNVYDMRSGNLGALRVHNGVSGQFLVQIFTALYTTGADGRVWLDFPLHFPTQALGVQITNYDEQDRPGLWAGLVSTTLSPSTFLVQCWQPVSFNDPYGRMYVRVGPFNAPVWLTSIAYGY